VKDEVVKSGTCQTKPALSMKRSILESNLLQSVPQLVYSLLIGDKSGHLSWTLAHFSGSKIFHNGYLSLFVATTSGQSKLIPRISWTLVRGPVIPCSNMHQSWT